ncbi:hypothetical protein AJ80_04385 [Polytolypa hystricis UAMH7299]|uniref:Carboxylesterase type B domain-containing protein n=1 Tax=Polytolypa hystricis (strain UAMH7299) TaxID=1447883 RepID=A0A2B7YCE3_POLH7|nr:hypothetical protein AJ80_04385 [Polytolypa hystricis UAMH7299]
MVRPALLVSVFAALASALPASQGPDLGIQFEKRADELPTLKLPYATYRAHKYDKVADIYFFRNIRFAAPPVGDLRWEKPAPPGKEDGVQNGSYGPSCVQEVPFGLLGLSGLSSTPFGDITNSLVNGVAGDMSEDCLFLDLHVPGKAVRNPEKHKLPVIMWFYGGAYVFGSKSQLTGLIGDFPVLPLYQGTGVLKASGGNVIWASSNYRLGAFGWLAGSTMENDATPNSGLWDQRASLQWVQDYIHLLGGDKSKVSAWGESAGAGSIYHHLVAFGGQQDPLFSKAYLMSPAFQVLPDRRGTLEDTFQNFAKDAGCAGGDIACLRRADTKKLQDANRILVNAVEGGSNVGPAPDGKLIRQLANVEYASGNYWKGIESLIVSHTSNEGELFAIPAVNTDVKFDEFIRTNIPAYTQPEVTDAISKQYPAKGLLKVRDRLKDFIRDSTFTCNTRDLTEAYFGKTYNLQYSVTPGLHALDLLPLFFDDDVPIEIFGRTVNVDLLPIFNPFSTAFQRYAVSHAVYGNPNTDRKLVGIPMTVNWPHPTRVGDAYSGVLDAGDFGFKLITDRQNTGSSGSFCDFILEVGKAATNLKGYAPPGSFMPSALGRQVTEQEASANYTLSS